MLTPRCKQLVFRLFSHKSKTQQDECLERFDRLWPFTRRDEYVAGAVIAAWLLVSIVLMLLL